MRKEPLAARLPEWTFDARELILVSLEKKGTKRMIRHAYLELIRKYEGNIVTLTRDCRIPRTSFYHKLRQYHISREDIDGYIQCYKRNDRRAERE